MAMLIELPTIPASAGGEGKQVLGVFQIQLAKHNVHSYHISEGTEQVALCFAINVAGIHQNIYCVSVQMPLAEVTCNVTLAPRGEPGGTLSSQLLKQAFKSARNINTMASKFLGLVAVGPSTGQLKIKIQTSTALLDTLACKRAYFSTLLGESVKLMNTFAVMHLYNCNRISSNSLEKYIPTCFRSYYFGSKGLFKSYAEIREIFMLGNYDSNEIRERASIPAHGQQLAFLSRYNAQREKCESLMKLWSYPLYESNNEILIRELIREGISKHTMPELAPAGEDHNYLFSTITFLQYQQKNETLIAEVGEMRVTAVPVRYSYAKSRNVDDQADQQEQEVLPGNFTKVLAIKLPHIVDAYQVRRLMREEQCEKHLKWEKNILSNLRGACSVYLPKYYHTVQQHLACRKAVIMDYLPGLTLHEKLIIQRQTFSAGGRLQLASHIANAICFLENYKIAHLDLTPANIIVYRELPKLIDFGEAYSPQTASHYRLKNQEIHVPGRTFPYSPPETTTRLEDFKSSQDIFSFGVILMQMFFGLALPSRQVLEQKQLYLNGEFGKRLLHVPEVGEYIGSSEMCAALTELVFQMLEGDELRRPYPWCVGLILRRLSMLAR